MDVIIEVYLFVLGLIFGSFMLVVVDRGRAKQDWVRSRSKCEHCKHKLAAKDLVPLLSWLSTGGKCRYCKQALSVAYPAVELGLGSAFLFSFVFWPYSFSQNVYVAAFVVWLMALVLMAGLFVYDMRWFKLPNKLVYPLIGLSVVWSVLMHSQASTGSSYIVVYGFSVLVSAGLFLAIYAVSKGKWIGDGDIRLGVAIGLFVGAWYLSWLALFIASITGVVFAVMLLIIKKTDKSKFMKSKIPFGPLLLIGLYFTVLFGKAVIDWYLDKFLLL